MLVHPIDRHANRPGSSGVHTPASAAGSDALCFRLPGGLVAVQHGAVQVSLRAMRHGRLLPAPVVKVVLPQTSGTDRQLIVWRLADGPAGAEAVDLVDPSGLTVARIDPSRAQPTDPGILADGLDDIGRQRLVRQAVVVWRDLFQLRHDSGYARFCRRLLEHMTPQLPGLAAEAAVTRHLSLVSGDLSRDLGEVSDIAVIRDQGIDTARYRPLQTRRGRSFLLLERSSLTVDGLVVVVGAQDFAVLRLSALATVPFLSWLRRHRDLAVSMRAFVMRSLEEARENDGSTAALLRELDLFQPAPRRNLTARKSPVTAAVELLVADGEGGVFVKGWVRDPHQLVVAASLRFGDDEALPLEVRWFRFPRPDIDKAYAGRAAAYGFVAHVPEAGPMRGEAKVGLELGSGGVLELLARPTCGSAADLRDAVLGGIPPERLTTEVIARIVAPAAVPLHRCHLATRRAPDLVQLGAPVAAPRYSIVVPLYRNLDYLRFQVGAFAIDPEMARAELIFVLDSPEQRADLVHFLSGLSQLYGLAMTILVMSGNFGYAAANNAGAAIARGDYLVLLNSDVVPEQSGWLARLAAPLRRRPRVLASGARLLFDDQSLQHAGMRFARDAGGHWLNLHYHKGAPREFLPALKARAVPAVTGAALLVRRQAFLDVGGFTEDYIIGDYEDSDLCLKLHALGGEIRYCPDAVLYHFERKSINRHAGYQRSVAGLYNRWLAGQRWDGAMRDLMGRFEPLRNRAAE